MGRAGKARERHGRHRGQRKPPRPVGAVGRRPRRARVHDVREPMRLRAILHLCGVRPPHQPDGELPAVLRREGGPERGRAAVQLPRVRVRRVRPRQDRGRGGAAQHAAQAQGVRLRLREVRHRCGGVRAGLPVLLLRGGGKAPAGDVRNALRGRAALRPAPCPREPCGGAGALRRGRRLRRRGGFVRRRTRRAPSARCARHLHDHLHVGDDVVPEGRGAHPRQPFVRRRLRRLAVRPRARRPAAHHHARSIPTSRPRPSCRCPA